MITGFKYLDIIGSTLDTDNTGSYSHGPKLAIPIKALNYAQVGIRTEQSAPIAIELAALDRYLLQSVLFDCHSVVDELRSSQVRWFRPH